MLKVIVLSGFICLYATVVVVIRGQIQKLHSLCYLSHSIITYVMITSIIITSEEEDGNSLPIIRVSDRTQSKWELR